LSKSIKLKMMTEKDAKEKYEGKWYLVNGTSDRIRIMGAFLNKDTNIINLILGESISIPEIKKVGIKEINIEFLNNYLTPVE